MSEGAFMSHMQSFLNCPFTQRKRFDEVHDSLGYFPHETLSSVLLYSGETNLQVI